MIPTTITIPPLRLPEDGRVVEKFGIPLWDKQKCPECDKEGEMLEIIAHLNNNMDETWNAFDKKYGLSNKSVNGLRNQATNQTLLFRMGFDKT